MRLYRIRPARHAIRDIVRLMISKETKHKGCIMHWHRHGNEIWQRKYEEEETQFSIWLRARE